MIFSKLKYRHFASIQIKLSFNLTPCVEIYDKKEMNGIQREKISNK